MKFYTHVYSNKLQIANLYVEHDNGSIIRYGNDTFKPKPSNLELIPNYFDEVPITTLIPILMTPMYYHTISKPHIDQLLAPFKYDYPEYFI